MLKSSLILVSVLIVALLAFGAGALHSRAAVSPNDVALEIPSDTGEYTLQCTVGMRIVNQSGTVVFETGPDTESPLGLYEHLFNYGIYWEDRSVEHTFDGKALRRELMRHFRRLLLGSMVAGSGGTGDSGGSSNPIGGSRLTLTASFKVVSKVHAHWTFAWKVVARNGKSTDEHVTIQVDFLDKDGFSLHDIIVSRYTLHIPSGATKTFSGTTLIGSSLAPKITSVKATVS